MVLLRGLTLPQLALLNLREMEAKSLAYES